MSRSLALVAALLAAASPAHSASWKALQTTDRVPPGWTLHQSEHTNPSAAYRWVETLQDGSARSVQRVGARPTIISREMHIVLAAMYDAWACYDDVAVGTRFGGSMRRPPAERTLANKEEAIAYAALRSLVYVYPEDEAFFRKRMRMEGYDPDVRTRDPGRPAGIGNLTAAAVIAYRRHDGANQHGDEAGSNGKPYSDYTFYEPRNPNDRIVDPDRWQRLPFSDGKGGVFYPGFLTPQWYRVKPFGLARHDQFRPPPPPKVGSEALRKEVAEIVEANSTLSPTGKAVVEFMRDGPRSTGQSGHWLHFAADVSRRDRNGIDADVKLFFAVGTMVFDAFISCWDAKRFYDSSRPWTLVRHYYRGQEIPGYLGACKGFGTIPAERWHPYSPPTFVSPPFPAYTSGHATASGSSARLLELLTGSTRLQTVAERQVGQITESGCTLAEMQAQDGVPNRAIDQDRRVLLMLPTFQSASAMAARSRMLGGYHISTDNDVGHAYGRKMADYCWTVYKSYFDGTAKVHAGAGGLGMGD